MTQTRLEYDRNKLLHDQKIVTDPEFNTAQLNYQLAKANATSAPIALWPTVSPSAGYNSTYSSATNLAFLDQFDQQRGGSIAIGVSIPIFDRGQTSVGAQKAKVQEDNAKLALDSQKQQVALEVKRAYLNFQSAGEQLTAAQSQQTASDLAVTTQQQRYQAGRHARRAHGGARGAGAGGECGGERCGTGLVFNRRSCRTTRVSSIPRTWCSTGRRNSIRGTVCGATPHVGSPSEVR